ncbi:ABC transporter ATP-binding protein [Clostridium frigidicarnis]|uniref:Multiple sugar transport system ATP-binding protein n=1 Tax=Clostridium frigidicarnis TaxID=84698 RepID=A0A1I0XIC3_9CLOT|nr:ABC transporter ATP-binding protein [Clostridium frigidicarnis]SFB00040.1 multiple sugar transport system ATP-binding protein [Clostridium frigidicarnis]
MSLTIKDLTVKFDNVTAVDKLDLTIEDGILVSLLGPSGCGKSTTLFTIAGFNKAENGNILFDDKCVDEVKPENRNIGMVFQNYALYPHLNVYENIAFPLKMKKFKKSEIKDLVEEIAKLAKIEDLLKRKPSQISGGQQQRVAIARALVKKPKILLLDEPLSNLDAHLRIDMREEIRRIQKELKITTVFVTHDQEEAMTISDKIALLNKGKLQQFDKPQNLYIKPKNLFVSKFLGNPPINIVEGYIEGNTLNVLNKSIDITNLLKEKSLEDCSYDIGIRCEDFYVVDSLEKCDIEGQVSMVEIIGREAIVKIIIKDKMLRCIVPYEKLNSISERIFLKIKNEKIYIFSKTTGDNLLV